MGVYIFAAICLIAAEGVDMSSAMVDDLWRVHWPRYASLYISLDDGYAPCAKFDRNFPSSRLTLAENLRQTTKRSKRVTLGNFKQTKTAMIPIADASAYANALPELQVGEYGYIHSSRIEKILGPTAMIVKDVRLIGVKQLNKDKKKKRRRLQNRSTARNSTRAVDTQIDWQFQKRDKLVDLQESSDFNRRLKIVGFDTQGRTEDERWPLTDENNMEDGVQIAIVKELPASRRKRSSSRLSLGRSKKATGLLVAVHAQRFRFRELEEKQFIELLEKRGFDKKGFVKLVLLQKKRKSKGSQARIIATLEQALRDKQEKARLLEKQLQEQKKKDEKASRKKSRTRRRDRDKDEDEDEESEDVED